MLSPTESVDTTALGATEEEDTILDTTLDTADTITTTHTEDPASNSHLVLGVTAVEDTITDTADMLVNKSSFG